MSGPSYLNLDFEDDQLIERKLARLSALKVKQQKKTSAVKLDITAGSKKRKFLSSPSKEDQSCVKKAKIIRTELIKNLVTKMDIGLPKHVELVPTLSPESKSPQVIEEEANVCNESTISEKLSRLDTGASNQSITPSKYVDGKVVKLEPKDSIPNSQSSLSQTQNTGNKTMSGGLGAKCNADEGIKNCSLSKNEKKLFDNNACSSESIVATADASLKDIPRKSEVGKKDLKMERRSLDNTPESLKKLPVRKPNLNMSYQGEKAYEHVPLDYKDSKVKDLFSRLQSNQGVNYAREKTTSSGKMLSTLYENPKAEDNTMPINTFLAKLKQASDMSRSKNMVKPSHWKNKWDVKDKDSNDTSTYEDKKVILPNDKWKVKTLNDNIKTEPDENGNEVNPKAVDPKTNITPLRLNTEEVNAIKESRSSERKRSRHTTLDDYWGRKRTKTESPDESFSPGSHSDSSKKSRDVVKVLKKNKKEILNTVPKKIIDESLDLSYYKLFNKEIADAILMHLEKETEYFTGQMAKVKIFGQWKNIPRKQVAYGNDGLTYTFSGNTFPAKPWTPLLKRLCKYVGKLAKSKFNFVLVNRYNDGRDHIGEHRDDEPDLDPFVPIASLSFGQERDFLLRHRDLRFKKSTRIPEKRIPLEHGTLLLMNHPTNNFWYHSLPRCQAQFPRINLTFRKIINKPNDDIDYKSRPQFASSCSPASTSQNLTSSPGYSSHNSSNTTPSPGYVSNNSSYTAASPGYVSHNSSYTAPSPGYVSHNSSYTAPSPGYVSNNSSYTVPSPGYESHKSNHPTPSPRHTYFV